MEQITVEALISKPISIVWEKYTHPQHITKWNFASDDWCCPHAEVDLREGGKAVSRMEAKDGSFGFDFVVTYTEVVPLQKLHYVMEDGRNADITFTEQDGKTSVSITFDPENQNPAEMQRQGWQAILNNFKKYVELGNE
jgi:uncharacterized protein YndB with AHSA1/START domain